MGDALAKELFGSAEEENQAGNQLRGDNHGEEAEEDQGQKAKAGFFGKIGGPGRGRRSQGDQGGKDRGNRVFHLLLLVTEKFRTVASLYSEERAKVGFLSFFLHKLSKCKDKKLLFRSLQGGSWRRRCIEKIYEKRPRQRQQGSVLFTKLLENKGIFLQGKRYGQFIQELYEANCQSGRGGQAGQPGLRGSLEGKNRHTMTHRLVGG